MNGKINLRTWHKLFVAVSAALIVWMFADIAMAWNTLPEKIPMHYNFQGEVDSYGSRAVLFILPVLALAILILLLTVGKNPKLWNVPVQITDENRQDVLDTTFGMLQWLHLCIAVFFAWMNYCQVHGVSAGLVSGLGMLAALAGIFIGYGVRLHVLARRRKQSC